jgi:hypothetical protein
MVVTIILTIWLMLEYLERLHEVSAESLSTRLARLYRFLWAALAGITTAQNMLLAKIAAMLLLSTIAGHGYVFNWNLRKMIFLRIRCCNRQMFAHVETYVIIASLCVSISLSLHWLNQAIRRFSVLYIVPVFQVFWLLVSVLGGLNLFREYRSFSSFSGAMFTFGILIIVAGVLVLSVRRLPTPSTPTSAISSPAHARSPHQHETQLIFDKMDDEVDAQLRIPPGLASSIASPSASGLMTTFSVVKSPEDINTAASHEHGSHWKIFLRHV